MSIGSIGVIRLPDFYSRTHAVSKSDTLGILLVIIGLIIYEGMTLNSLKLTFVVLFVMLSNPIGTHALARAAWMRGIKPQLNDTDKEQEEYMIWEVELVLFLFLILAAIVALEAKDLLVAVVTLTIFSFTMALVVCSDGWY
jgi:multicomponent Na+:H+ antiporter subunit G